TRSDVERKGRARRRIRGGRSREPGPSVSGPGASRHARHPGERARTQPAKQRTAKLVPAGPLLTGETIMFKRIGTAAALSAAALTIGCSSLPERVETLDQARELVGSLEQDSLTREVAPTRFEAAQQALQRAERNYEENEDLEVIEHDAYVALRNAQIAEQQIAEQRARDELEAGEAERNRVLLQAREREAEEAQQVAEQRGQALEQRCEQLGERSERLEQQEQQVQSEQQR